MMERWTGVVGRLVGSSVSVTFVMTVSASVYAQQDPDVSPVWAAFHGVDLDTIDLDADQDGDDLPARAEAVFGTDPFDRESAVGLRIFTGPVLRVTWDTVPGAR